MKTLTSILVMASLNCFGVDWNALWQLEGACRPNEVGVTGDLGFMQIKPSVFSEYARKGEKWYVEADNRRVAARIMDDRKRRYKSSQQPSGAILGHGNDFGDAILWRCPSRINRPTSQDIDFATRYENLCKANRQKSKPTPKTP